MAVPYDHDALEDALDRGEPVSHRGSIWTEERVGTHRMPDSVRRAAVRAVLVVAVTFVFADIAVLGALAASWVAAPAMLATVVGTIVATWAVLDVWVTRQVHIQRHGVVSRPSSAARSTRRGRARERRARQRTGSRPHLSGV